MISVEATNIGFTLQMSLEVMNQFLYEICGILQTNP